MQNMPSARPDAMPDAFFAKLAIYMQCQMHYTQKMHYMQKMQKMQMPSAMPDGLFAKDAISNSHIIINQLNCC
jgi:hypothetical protein